MHKNPNDFFFKRALYENRSGFGVWSSEHMNKPSLFKMWSLLCNGGRGVTFLSGDFVAKTGMWQASSGHQSGAIVLPSSSPHNQPGEFSSPEIKKRNIFLFPVTKVALTSCCLSTCFVVVHIDSMHLPLKAEPSCKLSFKLCQTTQN